MTKGKGRNPRRSLIDALRRSQGSKRDRQRVQGIVDGVRRESFGTKRTTPKVPRKK